jgi:hypothetical protein
MATVEDPDRWPSPVAGGEHLGQRGLVGAAKARKSPSVLAAARSNARRVLVPARETVDLARVAAQPGIAGRTRGPPPDDVGHRATYRCSTWVGSPNELLDIVINVITGDPDPQPDTPLGVLT